MKVIDLLNKIANGEEVPKKIKLNDNAFIYDETDDNEVNRYRTMTDDFLMDEGYLNDEVEIIEEDKKIEKIDLDGYNYCGRTENWFEGEHILVTKINEIIDYLNKEKENE